MEWQVWLSIAGITLSTFLARSTLLVAGSRLRLPPRVESALRFAPACALAANADAGAPSSVHQHGSIPADPRTVLPLDGFVAGERDLQVFERSMAREDAEQTVER